MKIERKFIVMLIITIAVWLEWSNVVQILANVSANQWWWFAAVSITSITGVVGLFAFAAKTERFMFRPKSGFFSPSGKGDTIDNYWLIDGDQEMVIQLIDEALNACDDKAIFPTRGEEMKTKLQHWKDVINGKASSKEKRSIQTCKGFFNRNTGWQFMSLNPFVKLQSSDLKKGPSFVEVVYSPDTEVKGVDITSSDKKGTFPIDIKAKIQKMALVDFDRACLIEVSTANDVVECLNSAVKILCQGSTIDDVRARNFPPLAREAAACTLIGFGLVPGIEIIIQDIKITGVAQTIFEKRAFAETEKENKRIAAEGEAQATEAKARGQKAADILNAEAKKQSAVLAAEAEKAAEILIAEGGKKANILKGQGEASALKAKLKALDGEDNNVKRVVFAKTVGGELPESVKVVSLGGNQVNATGAIETETED